MEQLRVSGKRLIGAGLFGFLLAGYAMKACDETVPKILSIIQKISEEAATEQYEASKLLQIVTLAFVVFVGSAVASLLARHYAVIVGVLSSLPFTLFFSIRLLIGLARGSSTSWELDSVLYLLVVVVVSILGATAGRKTSPYVPDLDAHIGKVTIFGVHWAHYFWIFPFILFPFLCSIIMAVYAGVLAFLADFYVALHPSLWFAQGLEALLNPIAVTFAFWMIVGGFARFMEVMRYGQTRVHGFGRFWRAVLYGVLFPIFSFSAAAFSATLTHALPKPTPGDWKIGLGISAALIIVWLLLKARLWIRSTGQRGLLNWLKLLPIAGTPDGCRESTRLSYAQHLRGALQGKGPKGDPPHHVALYGALGSWYKVRGLRVQEASLWGELAPFLLLPDAVACEAIVEYTVYLEDREGQWEGSGQAKVTWLADLINRVLRAAPTGGESPRSLALMGVLNRVAWYDLLAPDVRETLDAEVSKFAKILANEETCRESKDDPAETVGEG